MAERRMFHTAVVESDAFLDLPVGAQALYFHLGMHADDDGFINAPRQIARKLRRQPKDLRLLEESGFVLMFDGILVIKHWRMANSLKNDRIKPIRYPEIAQKLYITASKLYTLEPDGAENLLSMRQAFLDSIRIPKGKEPKRTEKKGTELNRTESNGMRDAPYLAAEPPTYDDDKRFMLDISLDEMIDILKTMRYEQYTGYSARLEQLYYAGQMPDERHYTTIMRWWDEDGRIPK